MKVALISKSGLLLFRNSRLLSSDHLYFRIMYAARVHVALLWPLIEWTSTLSVASTASSMKSNIALLASSLPSRTTWLSWSSQKKVRYATPIGSQWFGIYLPAQLMIWVTLLATTNSMSYDASSSPMNNPSLILMAPIMSGSIWYYCYYCCYYCYAFTICWCWPPRYWFAWFAIYLFYWDICSKLNFKYKLLILFPLWILWKIVNF